MLIARAALRALWARIATVFLCYLPEHVELRSVAGARRICAALVERIDKAAGELPAVRHPDATGARAP
jgi:hypothetical protein